MALRTLVYDIWVAGLGLQVVLAAVLLYRKRWQNFPLFFTYALFNLFEGTLLYSLRTHVVAYLYCYWVCEAISTLLCFAIVYEIFTALFSTHVALRRLATTVFGIAFVVLMVLGVVVIFVQSHSPTARYATAILVVAEASRFIEVGLLMFLFLFSSAFGLHWRTHVFGIALGLGVFTAVDLVNLTMRSYFGDAAMNAMNLARVSAFALSLLMWTAYLWAPEHVTSNDQVPERAQLKQWNQAVMELIYR